MFHRFVFREVNNYDINSIAHVCTLHSTLKITDNRRAHSLVRRMSKDTSQENLA